MVKLDGGLKTGKKAPTLRQSTKLSLLLLPMWASSTKTKLFRFSGYMLDHHHVVHKFTQNRLRWKRPFKVTQLSHPSTVRTPLTLVPQHHTDPSLLNSSRDSTAALGCLGFTTFSGKKFFLRSNLNLSWCNLRLFPLMLSLVTWEKRLTSPTYNWFTMST